MSAPAVLEPRPAPLSSLSTLADLVGRLGGVPLDRIRLRPPPGTATLQDVLDVERREGRLCELVEGTLVEKAMGYLESEMAGSLLSALRAHVNPRNAGVVTGPDGTMEVLNEVVRIPDVAFASWDRFPDRRRPREPIPAIAPDLAIEVLSKTNTPSEMAAKRDDYFEAGVRLVWEVDPLARTIAVYTSPSESRVLKVGGVLDGGEVLPDFRLSLTDFFAEFDRHG